MLPLFDRARIPVCAVLAVSLCSAARLPTTTGAVDRAPGPHTLNPSDVSNWPQGFPPLKSPLRELGQAPQPAFPFVTASPAPPARCTFFCERLTARPTRLALNLQLCRLTI
jgi:hypothetical protein